MVWLIWERDRPLAVEDFKLKCIIFGFTENIYGDEITLRFIQKIRPEKRFPSAQALQNQLQKDMKKIRECLEDYTNHRP